MVSTKLMTAEELLLMPDDGYRYDLIEGVLHRMSPAGGEHGYLTHELGRHMGNHAAENKLGRVYAAETGFFARRNPDSVLGPDIMFIRASRLPSGREEIGYKTIVPDLVVETASPSERRSEIAEKVERYLGAGVPLVWYLYPASRQVVVHRQGQPPRTLGDTDTLDGEEVLPGFRIAVASIFDVE